MKPKIYIETSVISYYTSRPSRDIVTAGRQQITHEWWDENRNQFDIFISALVLEEAKGGNPSAAESRLEALEAIPVLKITSETENLAISLVKMGTIPEGHSEDALHIALATVNAMDFLLTWNFHHINNAITKKRIGKVIEENGYECPVICSPDELTGE